MPRALITGVTGQDGGYLAERLLGEGWDVHGLVQGTDTADVPGGVVVHAGDLADPDGLSALIREIRPDEIYNLGGISSVAFSWEHPVLTAQVTGLGAAALFEAAWSLHQQGRTVRVLQAASAEIFGEPTESPQTEQTPIRPSSPYGAAKAFAQHMAAVYRSRGLHVATVILYNHESPRRPEGFVTRKITKAVAAIANGSAEPLVLGNLDARRDWGWAPDYVDAMVRAIRHPTADDYVIATGISHSVREFVVAAFAAVGIEDWESKVKIDPGLIRPADTAEQIGDATRARTVLGWEPSVGFEDLVAHMVKADLHRPVAGNSLQPLP